MTDTFRALVHRVHRAEADALRALGDSDTHPQPCSCRACELAAVSVDRLRTFEQELRRRDAGFMRVVLTNANLGTGTYETAIGGGRTATKPFTFSGAGITTPPFAPGQNAGHTEPEATAAPDPYKHDLTQLRAANATPESFEEQWKADRLRELASEHDRLAAERVARGIPEPRLATLSADDLKSYAPPDSYAAALRKETK